MRRLQAAEHPTPCRRVRGRSQAAAFTLIEMLVVILIISILLALGIGSIMRQKTTNRVLAAEQLIADFIRQARHTARSSGAPVVIKIAPADASDPSGRWTVSGVSRQCIWSESWDDNRTIGPTITLGLNGYGRTAIDGGSSETHVLAKGEQLVRGKRQDGFYLACAVKPLMEHALAPTAPNALLPLNPIPVMVIGEAGNDQITSSLAGMMLFPIERKLQPPPSGVEQPYLHCYELLGWVSPYDPSSSTPPNEAPNEVSSIDPMSAPQIHNDPRNPLNTTPILRDTAPLHPTFSAPDLDVAGPIGVDRWEEVALLFDGEELSLYRNGQRVGSRPYTGPANGLPAGKDTIFIGQATPPGGSAIYGGPNAVYDDARLYRLGSDQLGQLPPGVVAGTTANPAATYRITVHPDGRVDFSASAASEIGLRGAAPGNLPANGHMVSGPGIGKEYIQTEERSALVLSLRPKGMTKHEPGALNAAVITIATDGTVSSSLATWETEIDGTQEWPVLVTP